MSTNEGDVEISIDDLDKKLDEIKNKPDAQEKPPKKKAKQEPEVKIVQEESTKVVEPPIVEPPEAIEKLKKQLEEERAARAAAEAKAKELSDAEVKARTEVQDTNLNLIQNAITTVKQSLQVQKGNYAVAAAAGDWDKAAEAQEAMATDAAKLLQLQQGEEMLKKAPKPAAKTSGDPVEDLAANLSPHSASWVRSHRDYVTEARKNRMMIAAHELALGRGFTVDSDDYFNDVEKTLGLQQPEPKKNEGDSESALSEASSAKPKPNGRSTAPPAAPVSRSGTATGERTNTVRLSAAEVEMAEANGMTVEEYAANKLALQKAGRMN